MVADDICYYGLSKLIILNGTLNELSYGQGLLFYKDGINSLMNRNKAEIYFEQEGACS